jgi:hypothetical protein
MKNRDEKQNDPCVQIMHLLVHKDSDEFTDKEQERILKHIETCPSCRAFQEDIEELFTSFAVDPRSPLKPNPKIRKKALARLRRTKSSNMPLAGIRRFMFDFMRLKIPVYQAALGTMILLLAFFLLNRQKTTTHLLPSDGNQPQLYSQIIDEFYTSYDTGINPYPKIGRSLKEDSLSFKISTVTEWEQTYQKTDTLNTVLL